MPSTHSKPSEPLVPGGASLKVVEFWQQTTTDDAFKFFLNMVRRLSVILYVMYKSY